MISLSGLSATYPGYSAQEAATAKTDDTHAKTQQNQTAAREAAIKMLGAQALGTTLASPGPQAPPPGQASVPAPRPMPPAALPPPPGPVPPGPSPGAPPSPPPGPSAPAAAPMAGAPAKLGLQPMIAQILQANPGIRAHPEVLLAALNHAKELGVLDPEATAAVEEIGKQHTLARIERAKGHLAAVQDMAPKTAEAAPASAAPNAPPAPVIAPASAQAAGVAAPPSTGNAPPIATLKPNVVTTFANGQKWTVGGDGKPKQVQ
jgi:hypothetical protein